MPTRTGRPGNLPAEATSFIGRREEIAEARRKLTSARLVTLVGPGGVGKTRLAVRLGSDLGRGFADGVWLIELAELEDSGHIDNAVMAALDLRGQAAAEPAALLRSFLHDQQLLLVLDNCEHLLVAAGQLVDDVLAGAPGVRVLATSREPLSVAGEHVLPVPPLRLPAPDEPLEQLRRNEAISLHRACGGRRRTKDRPERPVPGDAHVACARTVKMRASVRVVEAHNCLPRRADGYARCDPPVSRFLETGLRGA